MTQTRKVAVLARDRTYDGYFKMDRYRLQHSLHDGGLSAELDREVLERGHVSAVLMVDPDIDRVVLIEQFRPGAYAAGWEPWLLECVAGIIEDGESPAGVAHREAREEAGCELLDLREIARYLTSPGACSETVILFIARVDASSAGGVHGLDSEHEDIKVHTPTVTEAFELLARGRITNSKTLIALLWLQLNYADLKGQWLGATQ